MLSLSGLPGSSAYGVFQQKYWSELPILPPGGLPDPRTEPESLMSPLLAGGFSTTEPPRKPIRHSTAS